MKHMFRSAAVAAVVSVSGIFGATAPAQAYQVDCAILLCLSGGWPASAPCAHARAVFIQRITPWPIEPPLQIWRCPMGASFERRAPLTSADRFYDIEFRPGPPMSPPVGSSPIIPVQSNQQADIDISGNAFDFVRSIRVYHIQYSQSENQDDRCRRQDATRLGRYGLQGDFSWIEARVADVPPAAGLDIPSGCGSYRYRAVLVDWRDRAGNYGFEVVHY
jgi:hypothetical protein